jgi:hypothetical protein
MSQHGGYLGWHRTENNGADGYAFDRFSRRPLTGRSSYRLFIRSALCRLGQLGLCGKTITGRQPCDGILEQ